MKRLTHPAMLALGAAMLCLNVIIAPLISPTHEAIFHLDGSATNIFVAVLLNLAALWLFFTLLFLRAERPGALRIVVWSSLTLLAPWILLKIYAVLTDWNPHRLSISVLGCCLLVLAVVVPLLLSRPSYLPIFERGQHFVATLFAFISLSSLFVVGQLLWFGWEARSLNQPRPLHQRAPVLLASSSMVTASKQFPRPRIIWLLLDELSYQQVYERRFPGLRLDAFDRLAAQSNVFTNASPPDNYTRIAVPSLINGRLLDKVTSTAKGDLIVRDASTQTWHPFDPHDTVFEDALDAGYKTAVAGWYNPYCRTLGSVLDRCTWSSHFFPVEQSLYADQSLVDDTLMPARMLIRSLSSHLPGETAARIDKERAAELHIADYRELFTAADRLLDDPSADFLFLHMPVPHPEGIYNRKTSRFTTDGNSSYIDNLALADQYLAHVRQVLEARGEWDSSAVIVMGDHSWRTKLLWESSAVWTAEDQMASDGGKFDERPAYIVKLPNQHEERSIGEHFATLHTRALLDGILSGSLKTPEDLAKWAAAQQN